MQDIAFATTNRGHIPCFRDSAAVCSLDQIETVVAAFEYRHRWVNFSRVEPFGEFNEGHFQE